MRRVLVALLLLAGTARADDAPAPRATPTFGAPYGFTEQGGETIYRSICAGCHMQDGRGATGAATYPSLVADPRLASAALPIGVVLHGEKAMPPFGRSLTDEQIAAVVTFIRGHFGNAWPDAVSAAEVKAAR
jgi:mono/diheme cytochrome c family protein